MVFTFSSLMGINRSPRFGFRMVLFWQLIVTDGLWAAHVCGDGMGNNILFSVDCDSGGCV